MSSRAREVYITQMKEKKARDEGCVHLHISTRGKSVAIVAVTPETLRDLAAAVGAWIGRGDA